MNFQRLRQSIFCIFGIVGIILLVAGFPTLSTPVAASTQAASAQNCVSSSASYGDKVHQFDYNANASLDVKEVGVVHRQGVSIHDITYVSEGRVIAAYLVVPAGTGPFAGIEFMHWLASAPDANRTEFLPEAVTLAQKGTVSLLPQGFFPWIESPKGINHDCSFTIQQVIALRRGLDLLLSEKGVDSTRIGFVGHDFGAMYGAVLAGVEQRIKVFVLMTPTARFSDWFIPYWLFTLDAKQRLQYIQATSPLDPITYIGHAAPAPILFQFAQRDKYVSQATMLNLVEVASSPKQLKLYAATHRLNDAARQYRLIWLSQQLGLK